MERDLREIAEYMKVPFSIYIMRESKNKFYWVSKIRKPHPHGNMGIEN